MQNNTVLIIEIQTNNPINIYPMISEDIANLRTAERNPIHIIDIIVIFKQIASHLLKFAIANSSILSFLYFFSRTYKFHKKKV